MNKAYFKYPLKFQDYDYYAIIFYDISSKIE